MVAGDAEEAEERESARDGVGWWRGGMVLTCETRLRAHARPSHRGCSRPPEASEEPSGRLGIGRDFWASGPPRKRRHLVAPRGSSGHRRSEEEQGKLKGKAS